MDILQRYKTAAKHQAQQNSLSSGAEASKSEQVDDQNDDDTSDSDDNDEDFDDDDMDFLWGRNVGTFVNRFAVLEPQTKRKKKEEDVDDEEKKLPISKKPTGRKALTSTQLAQRFTKKVPMDVGYHVCVTVLVWGGIGDAPAGRGWLIPGSLASFPETKDGFDRIRQRFSPLLVTLFEAWPGFLSTLLIHLIDCVCSIESELIQKTGPMDAGSKRKLFFLSSWVEHLLSRNFHRCHASHVCIYTKNDGRSSHLNEKPELRWTDEEKAFMQSPAPLKTLKMARLPLNSLCDRCSVHLNDGDVDVSLRGTTWELAALLNTILGSERIANCGLGRTRRGSFTSRGLPPTKDLLPKVPTAKNNLSLNDMEAILADDNAPQEQSQPSEQASGKPVSWVLVDAWDDCAIGSLPGRLV
jgi:hypothetical protein